MKNKEVILEIGKEIQIGDVLLEKGDKIKVLNESVMTVGAQTVSDVCRVVELYNESYAPDKNILRKSPELFRDLVYLNQMSFAERYGEEVEEIIVDSIASKRPIPSQDISQLLESLDCYLYQIEGSVEKHGKITALKRISDNFTAIIRITKEYDKGYWGD